MVAQYPLIRDFDVPSGRFLACLEIALSPQAYMLWVRLIEGFGTLKYALVGEESEEKVEVRHTRVCKKERHDKEKEAIKCSFIFVFASRCSNLGKVYR